MGKSPTVPKKRILEKFNFVEAVKKIGEGYIVSKEEWGDPRKVFCKMNAGLLMIYNEKGFSAWAVSEADMAGDDYFIVKN